MRRAHRVVWELLHGKIPSGQCVLHSCDNPACCNPDHLRLGTQLENIRERNEKKRTARGARSGVNTKPWTRARGTRGGLSKLTEEQVRAIRGAVLSSNAELAVRFGVHNSVISRVRAFRSYTEVV